MPRAARFFNFCRCRHCSTPDLQNPQLPPGPLRGGASDHKNCFFQRLVRVYFATNKKQPTIRISVENKNGGRRNVQPAFAMW